MSGSPFLILAPKAMQRAGVSFVESSGTAASMPWSLALNSYPHERARTSGLVDMYVIYGADDDTPMNTFFAGYSNATSDTEWRIRVAGTTGGTVSAPDYDSGWIPFWRAGEPEDLRDDYPRGTMGLHTTPGLVAYNKRYVRIDWRDDTNPDGYFEVGAFMVGEAFNPALGATPESELPVEQGDEVNVRTYSGTLFPSPQAAPINATYVMQLARSELRTWRRILRNFSTDRPVLVCLDYENESYLHENTTHGYLRTAQPPVFAGYDGDGEMSFLVEIGFQEA